MQKKNNTFIKMHKKQWLQLNLAKKNKTMVSVSCSKKKCLQLNAKKTTVSIKHGKKKFREWNVGLKNGTVQSGRFVINSLPLPKNHGFRGGGVDIFGKTSYGGFISVEFYWDV